MQRLLLDQSQELKTLSLKTYFASVYRPSQHCSRVTLHSHTHRHLPKHNSCCVAQATSTVVNLVESSGDGQSITLAERTGAAFEGSKLNHAASPTRGRKKGRHTPIDVSLGSRSAHTGSRKLLSSSCAKKHTASRPLGDASHQVSSSSTVRATEDSAADGDFTTDPVSLVHPAVSRRRRIRTSRLPPDGSRMQTLYSEPPCDTGAVSAVADEASNIRTDSRSETTERGLIISSSSTADRGSSRNNPILRAIRIVQLKQRRSRTTSDDCTSSDKNESSTAPKQSPAFTVVSQQESRLDERHHQQQQDEQTESEASCPAGETSAAEPHRNPATHQQLSKPRAALPPDEVLVTETSHLNPVYRRIRLQELRLRLQQHLRGPQLQQQLQQVQQQQQQLAADEAPQNSGAVEHARSSSSRSSGDSCSTRGPTQGLNSVQRAIRIAQLQRLLQQRHKQARGPNSIHSSSNGSGSDRTAPWFRVSTPATAAAVPWFLPPAGYSSGKDKARSAVNTQQQQLQTAVTAAGTQLLMQQLIAAGVSAAAASAIASFNTQNPSATAFAANSSSSASCAVVDRLLQLQQLLGLPSVGAAARTVIKQPNLLKRDPETLRHNIKEVSSQLQLTEPQVCRMLATYPAALDMCPASVAARAATLAATLNLPARQAVKVARGCPRVLGLSPATLSCKVSELQTALELHSKAAAVEVVSGFPAVLGLSSSTLAGKYQTLKGLAEQRLDWQQQLRHIRGHKPGTLGRVLAAGPRVVERLQYLLEAGNANAVMSNNCIDSGNDVQHSAVRDPVARHSKAVPSKGDEYEEVGGIAKSSIKKGGLPGGNLAALLIMSEVRFTALHPEIVLWRLKQRSSVA